MGAAPAGREWSQRQKRREKFPAVFISWLPSPQPQLPGAAEFTLNKERRLKKKKKSCVYKTRNASAKSFQRERLKWRTDAFLIRYDANLTFTLSWCPRPPRLLQTRQAESAQRLTLVCLLRASFSLFLPFPFVPFSCISFLMFYFLVIPATPFCFISTLLTVSYFLSTLFHLTLCFCDHFFPSSSYSLRISQPSKITIAKFKIFPWSLP